ncbi:multidrug efflux SMR transporter [Variovorax dokdonensis]|uniref:multidrug efflux SMR transporter n=1 Tax=Variovorax dokdonensis TaxID=344883 RepID=UPI0034A24EF0
MPERDNVASIGEVHKSLLKLRHIGCSHLLEVIGTTSLQKSERFTRAMPTLVMATCYVSSFYFLALVLKTIPVGLAYAIWSGMCIVLISAIGYFVFRQT